jgi:hypothetical protein
MAMKKTSRGDSPLRQGAGKSFWPSRSRVDDGGGSRCVSRKLIGSFRFFLSGGLYRRSGGARGAPGGPHHRATRSRGRPRPLVVWPPFGPPSSPLRTFGSFGNYLDVQLLFRPIPRIFPV